MTTFLLSLWLLSSVAVLVTKIVLIKKKPKNGQS